MDLAVSQVANFRPPIIHNTGGDEGIEVVLRTAKISPSDLPNEVEITRNNSLMNYVFDYSVMEPESNLSTKMVEEWTFKYSKVTGRLYMLKFDISNFLVISKHLKEISRSFTKKRLRDNLKFGLDLSQEIYNLVIKFEKS